MSTLAIFLIWLSGFIIAFPLVFCYWATETRIEKYLDGEVILISLFASIFSWIIPIGCILIIIMDLICELEFKNPFYKENYGKEMDTR